MELSLRMKQVADMVEPCQVAADIGCDHGYVSIYLIEQGLAKQVIAMDVRTGPLSRAEQNVKQKHLQTKIQCRLSDGLEMLEPGEADTIVIAGMGGPLMVRILEQGAKKRLGNETLILQPQSDIPAVRHYLHKIGYGIEEEEMLQEEGKYYTIIKAKNADRIGEWPDARIKAENNEKSESVKRREKMTKSVWSRTEYQYGKYLLEHKSMVLKQYLEQEDGLLKQLTETLSKQQTPKSRERLQEIKEQLEWNREARNYYEA